MGKCLHIRRRETARKPIAKYLCSYPFIKINGRLVPVKNLPVESLCPDGLSPLDRGLQKAAPKTLAARPFLDYQILQMRGQALPGRVASVT